MYVVFRLNCLTLCIMLERHVYTCRCVVEMICVWYIWLEYIILDVYVGCRCQWLRYVYCIRCVGVCVEYIILYVGMVPVRGICAGVWFISSGWHHVCVCGGAH